MVQPRYSLSMGYTQEEVGGRLGVMLYVSARLQGAASCSSKDEGKVGVCVPVAVSIAAAVNDHRVVKQRVAVRVFSGLEFFQKSGELPDIPKVDVSDLVDPILSVHMVRQVVVAFGDSDVVERSIAAVVS